MKANEPLKQLVIELTAEIDRLGFGHLLNHVADFDEESMVWIFKNKYYTPNLAQTEHLAIEITMQSVKVTVLFSNEDVLVLRTQNADDPEFVYAMDLPRVTAPQLALIIQTALQLQ